MGLSEANSNNYRAILASKGLPASSSANATDEETPDNSYPYNIIDEIKMQQKHLSEAEIIEVIAKYKSGISANQLAKEYHCHKVTIRSTLRKNGIEISKEPAGRKVDEVQMIAMYDSMHTIAEIARHFEVSTYTIRRKLIANNISLRTRWDYMKG